MVQDLADKKRSHNLLNRILDQPGVVDIVQRLEPGVLTRLIQHIGLEDAAEIISMATVDQLKRVFDEDLWRNDRPGQDEKFDTQRFFLWLEVMLESGPAFAAQKIAEFDEEMVVLALSGHLLVLDLDTLALRLADSRRGNADYIIEKTLESSLSQEFDQFIVIARDYRSWESILTLLVELNERNYDLLSRLLWRCAAISNDFIEDHGGLFAVLTSEEMLASDVAGAREERRQREGFVTPSSAAAFLGRIRTLPLNRIAAAKTWDHDTRLYFRSLNTEFDIQPLQTAEADAAREGYNTDAARFMSLLREAEVVEAPAAQKKIGFEVTPSKQIPLAQAMQSVNVSNAVLYSQRLAEITYLANILIAGCPLMGRRFRPVEAAEAALATCQLGAEYILDMSLDEAESTYLSELAAVLATHDMIKLFNLGWKILLDRVSRNAARSLVRRVKILKDRNGDSRQRWQLAALVVSLEEKTKLGKPWLFLPEIDDLLSFMDNALVASYSFLINEYPILPESLRRSGNSQGSGFISSQRQIETIEKLLAEQ